MRLRLLLLASVTTLAATPSSAAPANMLGYGLMECREFLEAAPAPDMQAKVFAWVGGFFSGLNYAWVSDHGAYYDLSLLRPETVVRALVAFCDERPDGQLVGGVEAMMPGLVIRKWER